ncbi:MAG: NAD(+) synthase [Pseudomonadales bacterium]
MSIDYRDHGYVRCTACAPRVALADPMENGRSIVEAIDDAARDHSSILLLPELAITGYTCEDLFFDRGLLDLARQAIGAIAVATRGLDMAVVVGAPYASPDGRLFNCAFVCSDGHVVGAVPKTHVPNYGEYYERRWFASGEDVDIQTNDDVLGQFRLSARQLFPVGSTSFGLEICEDLWAPRQPGVEHALAGAELILNLSASNELVAKAEYRLELVRMTSAQRICGYLYASSGPSESTKDLVFGGHLIAAENGAILAESERFALGGSRISVDFDCERIRHDRMQHATFASTRRGATYPMSAKTSGRSLPELRRRYPKHPFVPDDEDEFDARAREILAIQSTGLARRMQAARTESLVIGLSGGLDSTLAFLVCLDTLDLMELDRKQLHALTMPGPGTSPHTRATVDALVGATKVALREVDINAAVDQHLEDLGHDPELHDVVFENVQARERTQLLFNFANQLDGAIVVGTGDLSELALGWCTYNADHMANYNVNASVPKTMMAYLVRWYGRHRASKGLATVLERVLATPISPELVPRKADEDVAQHTEDIIGPYELHDFFLFNFIRNGFRPRKIFLLAKETFADSHSPEIIQRWLRVFCERFFSQQFKRTTLPPGPKVGTVSLSPRGDWRMPDEASVNALLREVDALLDAGS